MTFYILYLILKDQDRMNKEISVEKQFII